MSCFCDLCVPSSSVLCVVCTQGFWFVQPVPLVIVMTPTNSLAQLELCISTVALFPFVFPFVLPMPPRGQKRQRSDRDNFSQRRAAGALGDTLIPHKCYLNEIVFLPFEAVEVKSDPFWIRRLVRAAQIEGQMSTHPSVKGGWTDLNHDAMRLPDLLKALNWTNKDCLNPPGWGIRTRSGAVRQTFDAISTHLGKST